MLYKKPNMKYTDMAIYIDDHIYNGNYDPDLVFQYLYHIIYMLAHKKKFFNRSEYYEDFAVFMATEIYMRLTSPKQFEVDETGEPRLNKIKSCLNYIKKTLYPRKVDFEQMTYCQTISLTDISEDEFDLTYTFAERLAETVDELAVVEFNVYLEDIPKMIRMFLQNIPYPRHSAEWQNIYISCLLSFLNSVTLKNADIERLASINASPERAAALTELMYQRESKSNVILYHLDDSMYNYIDVLTREIKHIIAKDLCVVMRTYVPSSAVDVGMVFADINNELD